MILLQRNPKLGPLLFGAVLLLCACFAHPQVGALPAACSTLGGGAGACYVDCIHGGDGNPGSFDQPWRTPLEIGLHAFAAGDGIYLKRDCTWNDGIVFGAIPYWIGGDQYAINGLILPPTSNGHYYKNTSGIVCTASGSLPSWPTSGGTVTDGTCQWTDQGTSIPDKGTSGSLITIDSYGGNNSPPGTGQPPHLTGLLPIPAADWTVYSGHVWSSAPLYHAGLCSSLTACVACPSAGIIYSCLDQPPAVLNYVRFGTVWGNDQEANPLIGTLTSALTQDRDWYFNPSTYQIFVYCTCSAGTNPQSYYGTVAPIAVAGESSPANGGNVMLQLGTPTNSVSYVSVQHLLMDWYDSIGVEIPSNSGGSGDHIWLANMAANSYVENGLYRNISTAALCPVTITGCSQYTQIGFWLATTGTPTDVHLWNVDANMNYIGFEFSTATGYPCGSTCLFDLENVRAYGSRTYGIADYTGAAQLSYSHLYGNNLATALETDVLTDYNLPSGGITCSTGTYPTASTVTATWANSAAPQGLVAGEAFSVNTGFFGSGGALLSPSTFAGSFTVGTFGISGGNTTLTWALPVYGSPTNYSTPCPASSATGGSVTLAAVDDLGSNIPYVSALNSGGVTYSNLKEPWVQNWKRWPAYVTVTFDDPGLAQYSDNYVQQVLPLAAAKLGASNFSIAVVTGGAYSGLNVNGSDPIPGFVSEIEGWLTSGYDVLTHSTSHSYWSPPASSCGSAAVYKVPCHLVNLLQYNGSIASTVTLTISHNATTCGGLGVSSTACFVITSSPSDPGVNVALDISVKYPWSTGASTSVATLGELTSALSAKPYLTAYSEQSGGSNCNYVCFDQIYAGDASQALSHSLDDTYSSSGVLGGVSLLSGGGGYNLDFHTPFDTASEPPYFETDEFIWANAWMNHYITAPALPATRVYVMPGTYGDSASENVAATAGFGGVRGTGSLKPCCAANTTLANGYDKFNILSQGINPNFQNLTYSQMRHQMWVDLFKNALWGRPIGFFFHVYELPYDQVENMFDALREGGATFISNTAFVNKLLTSPCAANDAVPPIVSALDKGPGYVAGSFYTCPSTGVEADWRETANSPTLGTGTSAPGANYQYDLMGNLRSTWDMGAYQYVPMSLGTVKHP